MHRSRLVGGLTALAGLLILLAAPAANALPLPVVWSAEYKASTNDAFNTVATAPGGVVYAAGYAKANASGRSGLMLLAKYVDAGSASTREWVRSFQLNGVEANKIAVDAAGNVIVAGTSNLSAIGRRSIVVLKFSSAGVLEWRAVYDGAEHRDDYVTDLALDARGNALIVGASVGKGTGRDYITLKVRANGTRAWARRYAGPDVFDEARGVAVDPAGNVYVTGNSRRKPAVPGKSGPPRAVTIKYSASGTRLWLATVGQRQAGSGTAVMVSPDAQGVIVSGWRYLPGTQEYENLFFAKYDASSGKVIWVRTISNGADSTEEPAAAGIDGTGAPIAAGMSNPRGGIEGYIAGVSASAGDAWNSALASEFGNPSWAEFDDVAVSAGGAVLAGGWTQAAEPPKKLFDSIPSAFVVRYSPAWPITAPLDYVGPGSATSADKCTAVAIGTSGMYAVGQETGTAGDLDAVLMKF
jgi:Beta-propeller repeat